MVCFGIDVAKDKLDCFILNSEGEALADVFTIANNLDGFETLLQRIRSCTCPTDKIKAEPRFDSPDKLLAYAGLSPSTCQSGKLNATGAYAHMEKRGSRYLRYALFNTAKYVCIWDPTFSAYLKKKRDEGKHYNVAISHAAKKLCV